MQYDHDLVPAQHNQRTTMLRRRAADGWRLVAVDQGIAYWERQEAPCAST